MFHKVESRKNEIDRRLSDESGTHVFTDDDDDDDDDDVQWE